MSESAGSGSAVDAPAVLARVAEAAAPFEAVIETVVQDASGQVLVRSADADRPLLSASLVKLLVVQQMLAGGELEPDTEEQLAAAVTVSDDQAMDQLWTRYDGPALVRAAADQFELAGTAPPEDPSQWGNTTITAADLARFLADLAGDPQVAGRSQVLTWMRGAEPVAADGVDQRFGLLSDAGGAGVAAKQGWACCGDGRRQLHSAGVLGDGRVVVLLAETADSVSYEQARKMLDRAASALVEGTA